MNSHRFVSVEGVSIVYLSPSLAVFTRVLSLPRSVAVLLSCSTMPREFVSVRTGSSALKLQPLN